MGPLFVSNDVSLAPSVHTCSHCASFSPALAFHRNSLPSFCSAPGPCSRCSKRAAGLQPSFHPRSNRSLPCGRGRVAASTQRSYVARRPGPRRPRSAVRRACGLAGLGTVGQEGPVTRSESLDDAGGNTVHVNKRTSRYLRVLTELFQLVTRARISYHRRLQLTLRLCSCAVPLSRRRASTTASILSGHGRVC